MIFALVLLATTFVLPAESRADDILAHGTDEMFWIARIRDPAPSAGDGGSAANNPRTVIRGRRTGAGTEWVQVAQLGSRVTSLSHRGTELAALLDSGSWLLLWPGGSSTGAQPDDGARLLALAAGADSIFALAKGGDPAPTTNPSTTARARAPAAEVDPDALALYRLERGQWARVAALPGDITAREIQRVSFAVVGAKPAVSVLRLRGALQTYVLEDDGWSTLPPIDAADAKRFKLLGDGERPIVWVAPDEGAGQLYVGAPDEWSPPRPLQTTEPIPADAPRTVAKSLENVRLLFVREDTLFEQPFGVDGASRTPAKALKSTASIPIDSSPSRVVTLAAVAMLMTVVLGSLRRSGTGEGSPSSLAAKAGLAPAPLLPRFLAGVIDVSPLLLTCFFMFRHIDPEAQSMEDVVARTSLPFYLALAVYLVHTWLCETFFQRTLGKAAFGLRVVTLDGARPGHGAVFARNALRLVDVTMLAVPLLLVILSPLHQRVGDMAARTLVVSSKAADPASEAKPEDPAADSS